MAVSESYQEFVRDQLETVAPIAMKKMFGGIGIYHEGKMFGLISADERLYLKVDDSNRPDYTAAGAEQFMNMPYFELPIEALEDPEAIRPWMEKSLAVAAAALEKKKKN